jgi:DNA-binding beta-propeller fold protein YncE
VPPSQRLLKSADSRGMRLGFLACSAAAALIAVLMLVLGISSASPGDSPLIVKAVVATAELPDGTGDSPVAIVAEPHTGWVYVGYYGERFLSVLQGRELLVNIPLPAPAKRLALDPGTGLIYGSLPTAGSVVVVSRTEVLTSIPLPDIPESIAVEPISGYVYVVCRAPQPLPGEPETPDSVAVIRSGSVVTTLTVGMDTGALVAHPTTGYVYALNEYLSVPSPGTVTVISATDIVTTIEIGPANWTIGTDEDEGYVYASDVVSDNLAVLWRDRLVGCIALPMTLQPDIVPAPAGGAYVAYSTGWFGDIGWLARVQGTDILETIPLPRPAQRLAVHRPTGRVYAVHSDGDSVSVISGTQVTTVAPIWSPWQVAVNPLNDLAYVARNNGVEILDGDAIVASVPHQAHPLRLDIDSRSASIYSTNQWGNSVSVISDTQVLTTVRVGEWPIGVASGRDGQLLYAANERDGTVSIFTPAGVVATLPIGPRLVDIASHPANGLVYVARQWLTGMHDDAVVILSGTTTLTAVHVGPAPRLIGIGEQSALTYVLGGNNLSDSWVSVLRGTEVITTIPIQYPRAVAFHPLTGDAYLSYYGTYPTPGRIRVLSGTQTVADFGLPQSVGDLAISPASGYLYASTDLEQILVIQDEQVIASLPIRHMILGLAADPNSQQVYATSADFDTGQFRLAVISGTGIIQTLPLAETDRFAGPLDVLVHPLSGRVYVANHSARNIFIVDDVTLYPRAYLPAISAPGPPK